jgi:thiamine biosynthesis protein ThiS
MQLTINDKPREIPADGSDTLTVDALLRHLEITSRLTAVALNGDIIRREEYGERQVREGDRLEIVTMVGGG